jgi:hypothetical protein
MIPTLSIQVPFSVCCGVIVMSINKQFGIADLHLNLETQSDIVYALLFLDTSRTIQNNSIRGCTLGRWDHIIFFSVGGTPLLLYLGFQIVYSSLSFDDPGDRSTQVQMTSSSTPFSRGFIEHHFEIELG